ncbi:MAG: hypothetical protein D8B60_05115 [Moraxella sp.]|nr:MAG: hypothetical protein D8B60_05115 [Moraxella sp.]
MREISLSEIMLVSGGLDKGDVIQGSSAGAGALAGAKIGKALGGVALPSLGAVAGNAVCGPPCAAAGVVAGRKFGPKIGEALGTIIGGGIGNALGAPKKNKTGDDYSH